MEQLSPTIKYALRLIGYGLNGRIPAYEELSDAVGGRIDTKGERHEAGGGRRDAKGGRHVAVDGHCDAIGGRIDFAEMFAWCKLQSMSGVVATVLSNARAEYGEELLSDEFMAPWDMALGQSFVRSSTFEAARQELFGRLDELGIWHVPLKGIVISELYPHSGMREMVDNDILFDAARHADVRAIMLENGYTISHYGDWHDDAYAKAPCLNFEMHRFLDAPNVDTADDYYAGLGPGDARLRRVSQSSHEYRMTDEALYVHHIVHTAQHFRACGMGFRPLADLYLMARKLDCGRAAVERELAKNSADRQLAQLGQSRATVEREPAKNSEDRQLAQLGQSRATVEREPAADGQSRAAVERELAKLGLSDFEAKLLWYAERLWGDEKLADNVPADYEPRITNQKFSDGEWEIIKMMSESAALGNDKYRVALGLRRLAGLNELEGVSLAEGDCGYEGVKSGNKNTDNRRPVFLRNTKAATKALGYKSSEKRKKLKAGIKYLKGRALPPLKMLYIEYPDAKRHPVTVPYYYIYRIIKARSKAKRELSELLKHK